MRWLVQVVVAVLVVIGLVWFITTCAGKNGDEPLESATETMQEAGEGVQDAVEDTADDIGDAVD